MLLYIGVIDGMVIVSMRDENYGQKYDHLSHSSSSSVGSGTGVGDGEGVDVDGGGTGLALVVETKVDGEELIWHS